MAIQIEKTEFIAAMQDIKNRPKNLPRKLALEIAIIGRSNVGKSSLINRITRSKNLARTSSTPGRTQQINFFDISMKLGRSGMQHLLLVDLPGFGFAKLPNSKRISLGNLVEAFLVEPTLEHTQVVCLLNDIRREPQEEELYVRDMCSQLGKPLMIVLTKTDKLGKNEVTKRIKELSKQYDVDQQDFLTTAQDQTGQEFWGRIVGFINQEKA